MLSGIIGIEVAPVAHLDFEYQSLEVRYALLRAAAALLVHWPALFYVTCSLAKLSRSVAHSLTRSRLTDSFSTLPHWLRMEVDQYVDTRLYLPPLRRSNLQFAICRVLG